MIFMSVDYGDVRTGLAVCDKSEFLASPVTVINETYAPKLIPQIIEKAKSLNVEGFVVGLPKNMDGSEGFRAEKCREFGEQLEQESGIKVYMSDERLTTVRAHQALNVTNTRGKKRKQTVDAVAAVMILQDFLDYRKNHKI